MKEPIFITLQGAKLKRKDNQIAVYLDGELISAVPINRIDSLFLFGNVELSAPALNFLLSKNIDTYLLSTAGTLKGIITADIISSSYRLRLKQYGAYINADKRLEIAKICVREKLKSIEKFTKFNLKNMLKALESSRSINQVLGIEGTASNIMFEYFRENLYVKELGFKTRQYNPPPDPVNALLSLSYSTAYSLLFSYIIRKGFDPYISFLHSKRGTHASFVSDVMESLRVPLTEFVLVLLNKGLINEEDFTPDKNGYFLKKKALKEFIYAFHQNFIHSKRVFNEVSIVLNKIEERL